MNRYITWIRANYPTADATRAKCSEATQAMVAAFPELKRVAGAYHCPLWGSRAHWWCVDSKGNIVDPTAKQFPSGGLGEYEPLPDGYDHFACMECGDRGLHPRDNQPFCSRKCMESFIEATEGVKP